MAQEDKVSKTHKTFDEVYKAKSYISDYNKDEIVVDIAGNQTLKGGEGNTVFVFDLNGGENTIDDAKGINTAIINIGDSKEKLKVHPVWGGMTRFEIGKTSILVRNSDLTKIMTVNGQGQPVEVFEGTPICKPGQSPFVQVVSRPRPASILSGGKEDTVNVIDFHSEHNSTVQDLGGFDTIVVRVQSKKDVLRVNKLRNNTQDLLTAGRLNMPAGTVERIVAVDPKGKILQNLVLDEKSKVFMPTKIKDDLVMSVKLLSSKDLIKKMPPEMLTKGL